MLIRIPSRNGIELGAASEFDEVWRPFSGCAMERGAILWMSCLNEIQ